MSTIPPNMLTCASSPFSDLRIQTKCAVESPSESSSRASSPLLPSSPAAPPSGKKAVNVAPPAPKKPTSTGSAPRTGAGLVRTGLLISGLALMAVGIGVAVGTSGIGLPLGSIMAIVGAGLVLSAISRSTRPAPEVAEVAKIKPVKVPAHAIAQRTYMGRTFSDPRKVSDEQQFKQYLEGTRTMGVWGDELEILGLVEEMGANILVFNTYGPPSKPRLHPFRSTETEPPSQEIPTLELNYNGYHYTVKQGLDEIAIKGDGDCLYRATCVARNLYDFAMLKPSRAELRSVQPSLQEIQNLRHRTADQIERSDSNISMEFKQEMVQIEAMEVFAGRRRAQSL